MSWDIFFKEDTLVKKLALNKVAGCYTCIICHSLKVVDFLSMTAANRRKGPSTVDKGWYQVAWAFLKVSFMVPGIAR